MRLTHFRVRTLMLVVGVVALILWGSMMGLRSHEYHRLSVHYALQESGWREEAAKGHWRADFSAECIQYFEGLTRKYRQATWRPWMAVAPDPHAPGYDQMIEQKRREQGNTPDSATPGVDPSRGR